MSKIIILGSTLAFIAGACSGADTSSTIVFKNDDSALINLIIEPGDGSLVASAPYIKQVLESGEEKTITVSRNDLGKVETFSVKGTVKMPSLYNRCTGLFMGRDYKVVFTGSKAGGTVCYAEPIYNKSKKEASEKGKDENSSRKGPDKKSSDSLDSDSVDKEGGAS